MNSSDSQSKNSNASRTFKFRDSVVTDVGCKRSENQDAYSVAHTCGISLYIVADGMGGARGGATASALAVNIVAGEAFEKDGTLDVESLRWAIEQSNRIINAKSVEDKELSGMGTTVIALAFCGRRAIVAHVGDSRIYRVREGNIAQLTRDHTLVQELVDSGAIEEADAASHPIAHMLTRSLGPLAKIEVEIRELEDDVLAGDKYLLCSDGLYNLVSAEEILDHLERLNPEESAKALLQLALDRGGNDNITIEVVEVFATDDGSFSVNYPSDTKVDVILSGEADISDVDSLLEKISQRELEDEDSGLLADQDLDESRDESAVNASDIDVLFEQEQVNDAYESELTLDDADRELRNVRIGLMLMIGIVLATLGYSYTQYRTIVGQRKHINSASAKLPVETSGKVAISAIVPSENAQDAVDASQAEKLREALLEELQAVAPEDDNSKTGQDVLSSEEEAAQTSAKGAVNSTAKETVNLAAKATVASATAVKSSAAMQEQSSSSVASLSMSSAALTQSSSVDELTREKENLLISKVAQVAADTTVNEAPRIASTSEEIKTEPANQPIVWENEQRKLENLKKSVVDDVTPTPTPDTATAKTEINTASNIKVTSTSLQDQVNMVGKKRSVRERIKDVDAKLRSLEMATPEQVEKQRSTLETERREVREAIAILRKRLSSLGAQVVELEKIVVDNSASDEELLKNNSEVKVAQERLNFAEEAYQVARNKWRNNPRDLSLASAMSARSRELESLKQEYRTALSSARNSGLMDVKNEWAEKRIMLEDIESRENLINRHLGYLEAHTPLEGSRLVNLRGEYLREREALVRQLEVLRVEIPDGQEAGIRARAFKLELAS